MHTHQHVWARVWQVLHDDAAMTPVAAAASARATGVLREWLNAVGVPLLEHRLSFYDQLPKKSRTGRTRLNPNLNVGAFGRMDIGLVVRSMRESFSARGLDTERVLYTDTDVLFAGDVDYGRLSKGPLPTFAAGTEIFSQNLNSGVMLINATAWAEHHAAMVAYGIRKNFKFLSYDQTWVQEYFLKRPRAPAQPAWESIDDAVYNARAFMHPMRPRRGELPLIPRIWHWHGFKPPDVECWHRSIFTGRWPVRAWRDTVKPCNGKTRPRCNFMPISNSGCRYFGRLTAVLAMTPCYLRTYTYLLEQHRHMLRIARSLLNRSRADGRNRTNPQCVYSWKEQLGEPLVRVESSSHHGRTLDDGAPTTQPLGAKGEA